MADFKQLVRIANTDMEGGKKIINSLRNITGVSFMFANLICELAKIDPNKKTGEVNEQETARIESVLKDPVKAGAPVWMLNRRKDVETGKDMHIITTDLAFIKDNDIKMMKKIRCYRGVRHIRGLPVRGQNTRSKFRKNKGKAMGVKRRAGAKTGRS
jgi:small subunit ribosomal protein S13